MSLNACSLRLHVSLSASKSCVSSALISMVARLKPACAYCRNTVRSRKRAARASWGMTKALMTRARAARKKSAHNTLIKILPLCPDLIIILTIAFFRRLWRDNHPLNAHIRRYKNHPLQRNLFPASFISQLDFHPAQGTLLVLTPGLAPAQRLFFFVIGRITQREVLHVSQYPLLVLIDIHSGRSVRVILHG